MILTIMPLMRHLGRSGHSNASFLLPLLSLPVLVWSYVLDVPCVLAKSLQSCPTLRDPMDCSPPGSSVHEIFQARILEWVAISFSIGHLIQTLPSPVCSRVQRNVLSAVCPMWPNTSLHNRRYYKRKDYTPLSQLISATVNFC